MNENLELRDRGYKREFQDVRERISRVDHWITEETGSPTAWARSNFAWTSSRVVWISSNFAWIGSRYAWRRSIPRLRYSSGTLKSSILNKIYFQYRCMRKTVHVFLFPLFFPSQYWVLPSPGSKSW
jgi:hypothetical protein